MASRIRILHLPLEVLRLLVDHLDRGDQGAAACSCRALRDAVALPSTRATQRLAVALRSPHMPWKRLAQHHLVPSELHNLLLLAHHLNPPRWCDQGSLGTGAPSEWTFYRFQREISRPPHVRTMENSERIVALAPRQRFRRARRSPEAIKDTDVMTEYQVYTKFAHYRRPSLLQWVRHQYCSVSSSEGATVCLMEILLPLCHRFGTFMCTYDFVLMEQMHGYFFATGVSYGCGRYANRSLVFPARDRLQLRARFVRQHMPLPNEPLEEADAMACIRMLYANCPEEEGSELGGNDMPD